MNAHQRREAKAARRRNRIAKGNVKHPGAIEKSLRRQTSDSGLRRLMGR